MFRDDLSNDEFLAALATIDLTTLHPGAINGLAQAAMQRGLDMTHLPAAITAVFAKSLAAVQAGAQQDANQPDPFTWMEEHFDPLETAKIVEVSSEISVIVGQSCVTQEDGAFGWEWEDDACCRMHHACFALVTPNGVFISETAGLTPKGWTIIGYCKSHGIGVFCYTFITPQMVPTKQPLTKPFLVHDSRGPLH